MFTMYCYIHCYYKAILALHLLCSVSICLTALLFPPFYLFDCADSVIGSCSCPASSQKIQFNWIIIITVILMTIWTKWMYLYMHFCNKFVHCVIHLKWVLALSFISRNISHISIFQMVLRMVCNIWNYWVFSVPRIRGWDTALSPLERIKVNHWATY
jgi:hypothetical protein